MSPLCSKLFLIIPQCSLDKHSYIVTEARMVWLPLTPAIPTFQPLQPPCQDSLQPSGLCLVLFVRTLYPPLSN